MAGPAFKSGAMLPHPVLHPEVAPTALAALGANVALRTAARGRDPAALSWAIRAKPSRVPTPPDTARDLVLAATGFEGTPPAPLAVPKVVVLLDLAGLYDDELFDDPTDRPGRQRGFRTWRRPARASKTPGPTAATGRSANTRC